MRRHTKVGVDTNQKQIVKAIRKVGGECISLTDAGQGVPDVLASFRGSMYLLEIKNPERKWKLRQTQIDWHEKWQAPVHVVETIEEVLQIIGAIRT
jgi:Holliday junction resolvase